MSKLNVKRITDHFNFYKITEKFYLGLHLVFKITVINGRHMKEVTLNTSAKTGKNLI